MRKTLLVGLLVTLHVGGFAGAAAVAVRGDGHAKTSPSASSTHGDDAKKDRDKAHRDKSSRGHGPPPWAGPHKDKGQGKPADDWRAAWKALTPAQREARMRALAKDHAEGMEKWTTCVTDAGSDRAKREACEKPLPPGHAKRRS